MSARRKEPEVIVFEEPKFKKSKTATRERDICRTADVSELFSGDPGQSDRRQCKEPEELDFKATLLEVQKYAASNLTGKTRRRQEEEQILALGGKPGKRQKMPYPLYQEKVKAQRKKEKLRMEELRLSGMPVQKKNERIQKKGRGRWKESSKSLAPHIGSFSRRGLNLSDKDIARVKKSANRKHT